MADAKKPTMEKTDGTEKLIRLTPAAAAEIKRLIAQQEDSEGLMLRIGVEGGGCSGLSYRMVFDRRVGEFDHTIDYNGLTVVVDAKSLVYIQGTTIDFSSEILTGGFKFDNPMAARNCGCGTSFSV